MTSKPASTRWPAIGPPMMPRPMKATVVTGTLPSLSRSERGVGSPSRAPPPAGEGWGGGGPSSGVGAVQPAEAVGRGAAGLVLQPDPAVVTGGRELAEVAVQVELPGSGF